MRPFQFVYALIALVSSFSSAAFAICKPSNDVLASLNCLDGVKAEEIIPSRIGGYRQFEMTIAQNTDHATVGKEQFKQRLVLLHKNWNEPMVLQTSGYSIFSVGLSRLAQTFGANQIQVEHRFFSNSTPESRDWTKLNIEQSAADFHRITTVFKQLYGRSWVGTGASKGGMTSTYHRAFYPDDLDGTVADVAPLSFSTDDARYIQFVDNVGGEKYAECRKNLASLQRSLLSRRNELIQRVDGNFSQLGSAGVAFEHAVIELPFAFWQYGNPDDKNSGCSAIPAADDDDNAIYDFLNNVNEVSSYGQDGFDRFASYYYQSGTQLGGPGAKLDHLNDLRHFEYTLSQYMPRSVPYSYSNDAMYGIESWVKNEARGVMFVYGEYDPWSAGAYPVEANADARDVYKFVAPAANHSAKFTQLSDSDKKASMEVLARWFNKQPLSPARESLRPSLDEQELAARRRLRLR